MLSVLIPSLNEPYLQKTIDDILNNSLGELEIIVVLDGYKPELKTDPRVKIIQHETRMGMRKSINDGVALAKGEFIMKCDAHCLFAKGFDLELIKSCEEETVVVPRRYRLDADNWEVIEDGRPPIDKMSLSRDLHGRDWQEGNTEAEIEETPSSQGSCWLMKKEYFSKLELMDESTYGTFWSEFQEIGLKCWLSGGRVLVNKKTYYAHLHKKTRGYKLNEKNEFKTFSWSKQIYPLEWMWEKFPTMS